MGRRPPRSTRTDTLFPYSTLFRSNGRCSGRAATGGARTGVRLRPTWADFLPESACFRGFSRCPLVSRIMLNAAQDLPEKPALLKAMIADLQAEKTKWTETYSAHDHVVQAVRMALPKWKNQALGNPRKKWNRDTTTRNYRWE